MDDIDWRMDHFGGYCWQYLNNTHHSDSTWRIISLQEYKCVKFSLWLYFLSVFRLTSRANRLRIWTLVRNQNQRSNESCADKPKTRSRVQAKSGESCSTWLTKHVSFFKCMTSSAHQFAIDWPSEILAFSSWFAIGHVIIFPARDWPSEIFAFSSQFTGLGMWEFRSVRDRPSEKVRITWNASIYLQRTNAYLPPHRPDWNRWGSLQQNRNRSRDHVVRYNQ